MRSNVDLPQPDGPTKTVNEPSSTVRSIPWMTSTAWKLLRRFFSSSRATRLHSHDQIVARLEHARRAENDPRLRCRASRLAVDRGAAGHGRQAAAAEISSSPPLTDNVASAPRNSISPQPRPADQK